MITWIIIDNFGIQVKFTKLFGLACEKNVVCRSWFDASRLLYSVGYKQILWFYNWS